MRKRIIFMLVSVGLFGMLQSCKSAKNVPEAIKTAFNEKFPSATKVKWNKENDVEWEAEFKLAGKAYSANFGTDGNWKETEYEIEKSAIPAVVQQTLDSTFAGYKVEEVEMAETATGKIYEITIEKGETTLEVVMDLDGKVITQETKKDEEDDKN